MRKDNTWTETKLDTCNGCECQCGKIGIFLFMVLVTIFLTKVAKYLATIGANYINDTFK